MRVLLLHLDGKMPNLALMRIAAHHRALGDEVALRQAKNARAVEPRLGDPQWDRVYGSLIFESTRRVAERARVVYPGIMLGGTGWRVESTLADVGIDDGPLDYSDYSVLGDKTKKGRARRGKWEQSIGFAMRGCRLACDFCVVPRKEGRARANATIAEIWRGEPWPREILLLDNDFFGNPEWKARVAELRAGAFKVSFVQGINARMLNDETAGALASLEVRDDGMERRRIYTAWDGRKDERTLFRGLEALTRAGFSPDMIMVYMLVGHEPGETHADRDYRRAKLRAFGARPYPMPFTRAPELVAFQRWVIQRQDGFVPWEKWWGCAKGDPRKLGPRRVSLPLFQSEADA